MKRFAKRHLLLVFLNFILTSCISTTFVPADLKKIEKTIGTPSSFLHYCKNNKNNIAFFEYDSDYEHRESLVIEDADLSIRSFLLTLSFESIKYSKEQIDSASYNKYRNFIYRVPSFTTDDGTFISNPHMRISQYGIAYIAYADYNEYIVGGFWKMDTIDLESFNIFYESFISK